MFGMSITYDAKAQTFHLKTAASSYVLGVVNGYLTHLYYGTCLRSLDPSQSLALQGRAFSPNPIQGQGHFTLDTVPQEYPTYGTSDFRFPALHARLANGTTALALQYKEHRIQSGKPGLEGLPATYVEVADEAVTLEIDLVDRVSGLCVTLSYSVFESYDAIARSTRITNGGNADVTLLHAMSLSVDLPHANLDLLQLSGAWARERHVFRRPLAPGLQGIDSRRGASSHQQNPFIALLDREATEDHGNVYGFSFVYSGNFLAQIEVDQFHSTRVTFGINPFDFSWKLQPGDSFQTPEVVAVFSNQGLGGMSRIYHRLYRERLCRGIYRGKSRPILVNNWEATYFNFNADVIERIAKTASELGIELFVLDDGWFGKRDDDTTSLGDWKVDLRKLPGGMTDLVDRVNRLGLSFGLWFEPEMVSPDSDLYRAHPDWCLHVPDRTRSQSRNQLILDLSRADVCDYIIESVSAVLASAPIRYVKWDMNRHMSEIGSAALPADQQRETAHRYMLGLYRVMETITTRFPEVLFESCSGGGGRFDPGILHYMPQTWTSDNTDAVSRLFIQYGTSIVYPVSSMGSHVSAVPNHQHHRVTSLRTRGHVAMSGNFGYELDLSKFTDDEMKLVRHQVATYKELRSLIQFSDFYRLKSPFEGNEASWMFVSPDQEHSVVFYGRILAEANMPLVRLRLKGLAPERDYRVINIDDASGKEPGIFGGDFLMGAGMPISNHGGDFQTMLWRLEAL